MGYLCSDSLVVSRKVHTETKYSLLRYAFLASLARDLRRQGMFAKAQVVGGAVHFRASLHGLSPCKIIRLLKKERLRRVWGERRFIRRVQSNVLGALADGYRLDIAAIKPEIRFCTTTKDFALLRFCRLMQSVPAPRLLYRQIAALVRDSGQENCPLMGAIGLCSPVYTLRCRDQLFGWHENEALKREKINSCMQLAFCIAIPPYNLLRAGRLIAALACSEEIAQEFKRKYGNGCKSSLLAVATTSPTGLHSAVFNRLMLRPGGLYKRVGETAGYSVLFYSKNTLAAARRLVVASDEATADTLDRSIRTLKRALNLCGIPREAFVRLGMPKAVYVAVAKPSAVSKLSGGTAASPLNWPCTEEIVQYWKTKDLVKVLADVSKIGKVRKFNPSGIGVWQLVQRGC